MNVKMLTKHNFDLQFLCLCPFQTARYVSPALLMTHSIMRHQQVRVVCLTELGAEHPNLPYCAEKKRLKLQVCADRL